MKLNKVVNFFKSKSVVDVVYLVMMILIVTMIKDMIMSMYKKRKDKQWLNQAFGKTKGKKNVEGFTGTGWTTASTCDSAIDNTASVCDRLKFLLCDSNFTTLVELLYFLNETTYWKKNIDLTDSETDALNPYVSSAKAPEITNLKKFINIIDEHFLHELQRGQWKNIFVVEKILSNEMGAPHFGAGTVWGDLNISGSLRVKEIKIPRVNTNNGTNEYINAIRFVPDDNQGDTTKPHSINMTYLPWDEITNDQIRFQIRQVLKHKNTNWTDMYRKYTDNDDNRNYGINANGDDYNDGNENTYNDFAKNSEGNNLNEFI